MPGRKRGKGYNPSKAVFNEKTKMRKQDGPLLREREPCGRIVNVAPVKVDDFKQILEQLDKLEPAFFGEVVRKKHGQDVTPELRYLYTEDITKLRSLIDKHVAISARSEFDELLENLESDDRLVRRKTNHRQNSNRESYDFNIPEEQEPFQQELHPSQVNEQSTAAMNEDFQMSEPDIPNIHASDDGFLEDDKSVRIEFENQLEKMVSDDHLVRKKSSDRDNSNRELDDFNISVEQEPFQQELSQVNEQSTSATNEDVQMSEPDIPNIHSSDDGFIDDDKSVRIEFEEQLEKLVSDDHLIMKKANHIDNPNCESEGVEIGQRRDTFPQEHQLSQVNEQSTSTFNEDFQMSEPEMPNICASDDGFLESSAVAEEPPQFSNQPKNLAQKNFNGGLLTKLRQFCHEGGNTGAVQGMCMMINQRMTYIQNERYEYSLAEQQQFNSTLLTELRIFEQSVVRTNGATFGIPNGNIIFKEVVDMLQHDSQSPDQFTWPYFRYLSDLDLLSCVLCGRDILAAEHLLRSRKLRLKNLSIQWKSDCAELKLGESDLGDNSAGINDSSYRKFQFGTQWKNLDAHHTFSLFNCILQFYDVTEASISLSSDKSLDHKRLQSTIYQLLESTFGEPPTNQSDKIRIGQMVVESRGMVDFLRWFCPTTLVIRCNPEGFDDEPSMIADIDVIDCQGRVDGLMEHSKARVIRVDRPANWSDESIRRVLTTHRLSADNGSPREISYRRPRKWMDALKEWEQILESWSSAFEAEHGKIGRSVTVRNNDDMLGVLLQLH